MAWATRAAYRIKLDMVFGGHMDFRRAKTGHRELKMRQKHLFWHSMWSRIIFEKSLFFAPGGPC